MQKVGLSIFSLEFVNKVGLSAFITVVVAALGLGSMMEYLKVFGFSSGNMENWQIEDRQEQFPVERAGVKISQNFKAADLSPLILGNWLEVIAPIMKDVSPQAHRWWILVENEKWRDAAPMARLYIKPTCKVVEDDPSLQRTEQRGIALLIKSIPEHIKETMVSERIMTSTGIIFTR